MDLVIAAQEAAVTVDALCELSLTEVARLVATGKVSATELAQAVVIRIELLNAKLNAFVWQSSDRLMSDAQDANRRFAQRRWRGPLDGIPISVKDLFFISATPTTAGSKFLSRLPESITAEAWRRLKRRGALLAGKTNMQEFAFGASGTNPHFGPVRNPWDLDRTAGGSSGGSACAVAAGMGFASLGSDTGGSIRLPAAICGVTGLKPTFGSVSRYGSVPLAPSLDHVGTIAKSAEDCLLLLSAIEGRDGKDPATLEVRRYRPRLRLDGDLRGLRIGLLGEQIRSSELDVQVAVGDAISTLQALGAYVEEVDLPQTCQRALEIGGLITRAEAAWVHHPWFPRYEQEYGERVRARLKAARSIKASQYVEAITRQRAIVREVTELHSRYDLLAGPTSPRVAAEPGDAEAAEADRPSDFIRFTYLYNLTGQPAVSVPCGLSRDILPIGLQLAAPRWRDEFVLRVAMRFQDATDWHRRRSPAVFRQP
jgi:aspartyl-tRNA(Asn)/glutamyl-tRNA(Gln) amidotransferase subunit A